MTRRRILAGAVAAVALSLTLTTAAGSQEPVAASASTSTVRPSQTVQVGGTGWPDAAEVQVQVCGNQALAGSVDCDSMSTATTASVAGQFGLNIRITTPPKPCPCVLWVTTPQSADNVRIPIVIVGATNADPVAPTAPELRGLAVVSSRVEGRGSVPSWFGFRPSRTLVLTVHNPTDQEQPVRLRVVVRSNDHDEALELPGYPAVPPGEDAELRATIDLDRWAIGGFTVSGTLNDGADARGFRVESATFPVGLAVLIALLFAASAYLWRRGSRPAAPVEPVEPVAEDRVESLVG